MFEYKMSCNDACWCFRIKSLRSIGAVGLCRYDEKTIYVDSDIFYLFDISFIKEIVLHEISHALTIPEMNHNSIWRAIYKEIGGDLQLAPKI